MIHGSTKEFSIFGLILGLALLMMLPLPVQAQIEQKQEAIEIMRTAIEYVYYDMPEDPPDNIPSELKPLYPPDGSLADRVKIAPVGIRLGIPSDGDHFQEPSYATSVSDNARRNLAEELATRMGAETGSYEESIRCTVPDPSKSEPQMKDCQFVDEDTRELMTASIPQIRDSEARVVVGNWGANGGPVGFMRAELKLRRGAEGKWKVTEVISKFFIN